MFQILCGILCSQYLHKYFCFTSPTRILIAPFLPLFFYIIFFHIFLTYSGSGCLPYSAEEFKKNHLTWVFYASLCCSAGQFPRDRPARPAPGNWRHGADPGEMWRWDTQPAEELYKKWAFICVFAWEILTKWLLLHKHRQDFFAEISQIHVRTQRRMFVVHVYKVPPGMLWQSMCCKKNNSSM